MAGASAGAPAASVGAARRVTRTCSPFAVWMVAPVAMPTRSGPPSSRNVNRLRPARLALVPRARDEPRVEPPPCPVRAARHVVDMCAQCLLPTQSPCWLHVGCRALQCCHRHTGSPRRWLSGARLSSSASAGAAPAGADWATRGTRVPACSVPQQRHRRLGERWTGRPGHQGANREQILERTSAAARARRRPRSAQTGRRRICACRRRRG